MRHFLLKIVDFDLLCQFDGAGYIGDRPKIWYLVNTSRSIELCFEFKMFYELSFLSRIGDLGRHCGIDNMSDV